MKPVKDDWYKFCRIYLEFINPKQRASAQEWEEYIEKSVETAKSVGLNTLAFDPYYGGYAIHKGSIAPSDYNIGEVDIFGMVERAVHKRGMKLVAFSMGMHFQPYAYTQYPSWVQRDSKGEPVQYTENWILMCPNSPFGNYLIQDYGRLISQYPIDGIYMEGLYFGDDACYCPYCREKFLNTYGFKMLSEEAQRKPREYANFRANSLTDFVRRMRRMIEEKSPETVWMASPSSFGDDWADSLIEFFPNKRPKETDFASWGKYVDVIHMERQWGYPTVQSFPLRNIGQSMQIMKAETHKPAFGTNFISKSVDLDYSQRSSPHFKLNFAEILLYGATPQIHVQNALEVDQTLIPSMQEMYSLVENLRPYLLNSKLVAYAAILIDWSSYKPSDSFKGFYKTMIEEHIPFEVISKEDIRAGKLGQYKVLILPDVGCLDKGLIEKIEAYVTEGGGLVMTYRASCTDEAGLLRKRMALSSLAGIKGPFGIVVNPPKTDKSISGSLEYGILSHNYYVVSGDHDIGRKLKNRTLSFMGSYVEVEATSTAKVVAQVIDYDYSKMRSSHGCPGWYPYKQQPISPLIVINENKNGGRIVYFAAGLDAVVLHEGDPGAVELLSNAVKWAGKAELPVQADCPPTVEVATHYDESQKLLLIFLVNHTSNQLYPDPIRYVVPVKNVTIKLKVEHKPKNVSCVTGSSIKYTYENQDLKIILSKLKEYEAVTIEL